MTDPSTGVGVKDEGVHHELVGEEAGFGGARYAQSGVSVGEVEQASFGRPGVKARPPSPAGSLRKRSPQAGHADSLGHAHLRLRGGREDERTAKAGGGHRPEGAIEVLRGPTCEEPGRRRAGSPSSRPSEAATAKRKGFKVEPGERQAVAPFT